MGKRKKEIKKKLFSRKSKLIVGFAVLMGLLFTVFILPGVIKDETYEPRLGGELRSLGVGDDVVCIPDCLNQTCGLDSDGCGGICECPVNTLCNQNTWECDSIE